MRKLFLMMTLSLISISVVFSAQKGSVKIEKGQKLIRQIEAEPTFFNDGVDSRKPVVHNNRNASVLTLIDSSTNGFGMVSSVTRPLSVTEDEQWFVSYRQYWRTFNANKNSDAGFVSDND